MRYYLLNLYLRRVLIAVLVDASCFVFAAAVVSWFLLEPDFSVQQYATATLGGVLASFVALYYTGAYGLTTLGSGRRTVESVFAAMGTAFVLALVVYFSLRTPPRAMEALAHTAAIYFPLLLGGRLCFRMVSALPRFSQHVLVIGTSDLGSRDRQARCASAATWARGWSASCPTRRPTCARASRACRCSARSTRSRRSSTRNGSTGSWSRPRAAASTSRPTSCSPRSSAAATSSRASRSTSA